MFLNAKSRVAQLTALNEELGDLLDEARFQGRTSDCREIALRRRQVWRAILVAGEFETCGVTDNPLTVSDILARY